MLLKGHREIVVFTSLTNIHVTIKILYSHTIDRTLDWNDELTFRTIMHLLCEQTFSEMTNKIKDMAVKI